MGVKYKPASRLVDHKIQVHLSAADRKRVREAAAADGRSMSDWMRRAVRLLLEQQQQQAVPG